VVSAVPGYWHRLQGLRRNAKLYLVSTVFRATSLGIFSLLFNLYLASLGFDEPFIGLTNTLLAVFSLVSSLPAGFIGDRIGRKRAMLIGLVGMVLSRLGIAVFSQGGLIAASSALFSIVGPLFFASVPAFLTENSTARERATLFTVDASLMCFVSFLATTAGGYLPRLFASVLHVGPESVPAYRGAMFVSAAVMALTLVPVFGLADTAVPSSSRPAPRLSLRLWRQYFNVRLLAMLFVPRLVFSFGAGLLFPFLNLFYKERFGVSDATLGWIFGITEVVAGLMTLARGALAERWGKVRALLVARLVSMPMLLIVGFVPSLPVVSVAQWVRSGLMRLGGPLYVAFAMEQLDDGERALGGSLLSMGWDVGWSAGPYVSGLLQTAFGFGPLFLATAALYGVSLGCIYRFFGRRRGGDEGD